MDQFLPFLVVGVSVGAVYALSGVGLVVLYRASGVVNFSYGALGGLAAMLGAGSPVFRFSGHAAMF